MCQKEISVIGSGYVGTTIAACFADLGDGVVTIDVDEDVVKAMNAGERRHRGPPSA